MHFTQAWSMQGTGTCVTGFVQSSAVTKQACMRTQVIQAVRNGLYDDWDAVEGIWDHIFRWLRSTLLCLVIHRLLPACLHVDTTVAR